MYPIKESEGFVAQTEKSIAPDNAETTTLTTKLAENLNVDDSFRIIFNKNSLNSLVQINFLAKNYRPKCDICNRLCNIDWYMLKKSEGNNKSFLICELCFESEKFTQENYKKEDFEMANFFNIINPSESKYYLIIIFLL